MRLCKVGGDMGWLQLMGGDGLVKYWVGRNFVLLEHDYHGCTVRGVR